MKIACGSRGPNFRWSACAAFSTKPSIVSGWQGQACSTGRFQRRNAELRKATGFCDRTRKYSLPSFLDRSASKPPRISPDSSANTSGMRINQGAGAVAAVVSKGRSFLAVRYRRRVRCATLEQTADPAAPTNPARRQWADAPEHAICRSRRVWLQPTFRNSGVAGVFSSRNPGGTLSRFSSSQASASERLGKIRIRSVFRDQ